MRKLIIWVFVIVIIIVIATTLLNKNPKELDIIKSVQDDSLKALSAEDNKFVKEFSMTSFVEMVDGKPKPQYSLKEITVNKGDTVRIKITVTSGMHDFKIDEYGVYSDTQLDKESVVEFVADQAGDFVYYCTKPGHRENGHFGILKVIE